MFCELIFHHFGSSSSIDKAGAGYIYIIIFQLTPPALLHSSIIIAFLFNCDKKLCLKYSGYRQKWCWGRGNRPPDHLWLVLLS